MQDTLIINSEFVKLLDEINENIKVSVGSEDYSTINNLLTPILVGVSYIFIFLQIYWQRKGHKTELANQNQQNKDQIDLITNQHKADLALVHKQIEMQISQRDREVFNERFDILRQEMTDLVPRIFKESIKNLIGEIKPEIIEQFNGIRYFDILFSFHSYLRKNDIYQKFERRRLSEDQIIEHSGGVLHAPITFMNFYFKLVVEFHYEIQDLLIEIHGSNLIDKEKKLLYDKITKRLLPNYIYTMERGRHWTLVNNPEGEWSSHFDLTVFTTRFEPVSMFEVLHYDDLWNKMVELGIVKETVKFNPLV